MRQMMHPGSDQATKTGSRSSLLGRANQRKTINPIGHNVPGRLGETVSRIIKHEPLRSTSSNHDLVVMRWYNSS